jgi:hypothetical protein
VNRSVLATAVASLFVLSAQAAFADTSSNSAQIAAPVVAGSTAAVAPSTASISMPAPVAKPAARIPGYFPNATYQEGLYELHVLMPGLSGNI